MLNIEASSEILSSMLTASILRVDCSFISLYQDLIAYTTS